MTPRDIYIESCHCGLKSSKKFGNTYHYAMSMYALATVPLIRQLHSTVPDASQVWFADDATAVGTASAQLDWWHHLVSAGPAFGYFPNSLKIS